MQRKHPAVFGIPTVLFAVVAASAAAAASGAEDRPKPIETFTCFAAQMERGAAGVIDINIFRWSTDEEREMLLTTLQEFGRDKLIDTLMKIRPVVGYMRTPNSIGYDLYYARNNPMPDGGRHVVMATNRRVNIREAQQNRRSMDYQLTVIELQLDQNGKGEGKMVPAAKITWDTKKKAIEIENFRALPVDLINVQAKKP
jgi:hypothetical protein